MPARLPIGRFPRWLGRTPLRRILVHDPADVIKPNLDSAQFQRAMFNLHLGGTVRITWVGRQAESDRLLLDQVDLTGATIVEMGASDGMVSRDLILASHQNFTRFVITDRFLQLSYVARGTTIFLFRDDTCVLISYPRLLLWPELSPLLSRLLGRAITHAASAPRQAVSLLNPLARELVEADDRVIAVEHDVFEPLEAPVEVIKVGNLLRHVYFSDAQIRQALYALHASLVDGGHLLVTGSLPAGETGGLYQKTASGFRFIADTGAHPEIHDQVESFALVTD